MLKQFYLTTFIAGAILLIHSISYGQTPSSEYREWGLSTLKQIRADFWIEDRGMYADEISIGQSKQGRPAFMWGCGVQLSALSAAAQLDRHMYAPQVAQYVKSLDSYWMNADGISGYDVLPGPKTPDRYYDDNAWMTLSFIEAYENLGDPGYLRRAIDTFKFVMSGEDDLLGGGIYWHEQEKKSKNTCVNAPAAVAALKLNQITHEKKYLDIGKRLYTWTNMHLQDTDGLFFDKEDLDGKIDKTKWSYNSALMIQANLQLYAIEKGISYLAEAERIGKSAEKKWIHADTGALNDIGAFAHLLTEAFLALYKEDQDVHWLRLVGTALKYLHNIGRDPNGYYSENWSSPQPNKLDKTKLLSQASAARAFLRASRYFAVIK